MVIETLVNGSSCRSIHSNELVTYLPGSYPTNRNTGILPVRQAGFQPASISIRRQHARRGGGGDSRRKAGGRDGPHSLEGCVPILSDRLYGNLRVRLGG